MDFEARITEEMKAAMKAGQKVRLGAIRSIRTVILEFKKSGTGAELTEADAIKILNTQAKKRREAMEMYEQGGRDDMFAIEKEELDVIMEFLPKQLDDEELKSIIKEVIEEVGAAQPSDMGKVMGPVMKKTAGKAEGNKVRQLVQELLSA
jgi:uncharacterized protein YqeY